MSDFIFPDNAELVPIPAGTEKMFAARQSDGKIIYFTGAQLFAALLELKTINNQSLIGRGNLTITGGTGGPVIIEPWVEGSYGANQVVTKVFGNKQYFFVSKESENTDEPMLSGRAWTNTEQIGYPNQWGSFTFYDKDEIVWMYFPGDFTRYNAYKSKDGGNYQNNPIDSTEFWDLIGEYINGNAPVGGYSQNMMAVDPATMINYVSNLDNNTYGFEEHLPTANKWAMVGVEETDLTSILMALNYNRETINNVYLLLDGKQAKLTSGTNIKTINGVSVLGSGDLVVSGGGGVSLGETDTTAYRGDRGKVAYDFSQAQPAINTALAAKDTTLEGQIATIMALLNSDNTALDTIQEIVDYIEQNRESIDAVLVDKLNKAVYDAYVIANDAAVANKVDEVAGKGLSTEDFSPGEKAKLSTVAMFATANSSDASLKNRANHTGTQPAFTIDQDILNRFVTDAQISAWNAKLNAAIYDGFVAANITAMAAKADLVGGKLKPEQAIDAKLSDAQFEQLTVEGVPQDITVKESWLTDFILSVGAAQGWSGLTALGTPVLTFGTSTSAQNVLNWTRPANGVSSTVQALIGGTWTTIYTSTALTFTHTGLTASTSVDYRVKATASGYADSAWATGSKSTVAEGGGGYVVENTFLIDFGSEYGDAAPAGFNDLRPAASLIQTDNGFTSPVLLDNTGGASLITITNSGAFGGATAQLSTDQAAAGNTGAFPNNAVNTAWTLNGGTNAALLIDHLNAAKFYEIGFLMPKDAADSVRGVTISGTTKNRDATGTNLQSFGLAANGLDDPQFIVFTNITGVTSVSALIKRVSGDYGAFLSMMYIRVSSVAKP